MPPKPKPKQSVSEDLETVVYPSGKKKIWSVGETIANRQDKVRHFIAISIITTYLILTIILIVLSVTGKCGSNSINCNSLMYQSFSLIVGVVIGFYFSQHIK